MVPNLLKSSLEQRFRAPIIKTSTAGSTAFFHGFSQCDRNHTQVSSFTNLTSFSRRFLINLCADGMTHIFERIYKS